MFQLQFNSHHKNPNTLRENKTVYVCEKGLISKKHPFSNEEGCFFVIKNSYY